MNKLFKKALLPFAVVLGIIGALTSLPAVAGNYSDVDQTGNCNLLGVVQNGDNWSFVSQENTGRCRDYNLAIVAQQGENAQATLQEGKGLKASTVQQGTNGALTVQRGVKDTAITNQEGFQNLSGALQFGDHNFAYHDQLGEDNIAATGQFGNENGSAIAQSGVENTAVALQLGDDNESSISQEGFGNTVISIQMSGSAE